MLQCGGPVSRGETIQAQVDIWRASVIQLYWLGESNGGSRTLDSGGNEEVDKLSQRGTRMLFCGGPGNLLIRSMKNKVHITKTTLACGHGNSAVTSPYFWTRPLEVVWLVSGILVAEAGHSQCCWQAQQHCPDTRISWTRSNIQQVGHTEIRNLPGLLSCIVGVWQYRTWGCTVFYWKDMTQVRPWQGHNGIIFIRWYLLKYIIYI